MNGSAPGISASFLNAIENVLVQPSGGTETGGYWMQFGGFQASCNVGTWFSTVSRVSVPVSAVPDLGTSPVPTSGAVSPNVGGFSQSGFFLQYAVTTVTNTSRVGGQYTVNY